MSTERPLSGDCSEKARCNRDECCRYDWRLLPAGVFSLRHRARRPIWILVPVFHRTNLVRQRNRQAVSRQVDLPKADVAAGRCCLFGIASTP